MPGAIQLRAFAIKSCQKKVWHIPSSVPHCPACQQGYMPKHLHCLYHGRNKSENLLAAPTSQVEYTRYLLPMSSLFLLRGLSY